MEPETAGHLELDGQLSPDRGGRRGGGVEHTVTDRVHGPRQRGCRGVDPCRGKWLREIGLVDALPNPPTMLQGEVAINAAR